MSTLRKRAAISIGLLAVIVVALGVGELAHPFSHMSSLIPKKSPNIEGLPSGCDFGEISKACGNYTAKQTSVKVESLDVFVLFVTLEGYPIYNLVWLPQFNIYADRFATEISVNTPIKPYATLNFETNYTVAVHGTYYENGGSVDSVGSYKTANSSISLGELQYSIFGRQFNTTLAVKQNTSIQATDTWSSDYYWPAHNFVELTVKVPVHKQVATVKNISDVFVLDAWKNQTYNFSMPVNATFAKQTAGLAMSVSSTQNVFSMILTNAQYQELQQTGHVQYPTYYWQGTSLALTNDCLISDYCKLPSTLLPMGNNFTLIFSNQSPAKIAVTITVLIQVVNWWFEQHESSD